MGDRQRSQQVGLENQSQQHDRDDAASGWPGKRSLTQQLSGSSGQALPDSLSGSLSKSLGSDVSGVRVHVDGGAADAAASMNARAFTTGQAVYFGAGQYDPHSQSGQRLIAHEVAHTVQQKGAAGGTAQMDSLDVSRPGDSHEVEAESFAQSFISGGKSSVTPVSKGVIARAVIQRDLIDGSLPAGLDKSPTPVEAKEPSAGELTEKARESIRKERGGGGTNAVVKQVHTLRNNATPKTRAPVENAISSELNDEEKGALEGKKPDANKAANAEGQGTHKVEHTEKSADPHPVAKNADKKDQEHAKENAKADKGEGNVEHAGAKEEKNAGGGEGGEHHADGKGDQSANEHGQKGAHGGNNEHDKKAAGEKHGDAHGGAHGGEHGGGEHGGGHGAEHGAGDEHAAQAAAAASVSGGEGKELIEQELAFHDRWKAYQGSRMDRAIHLAKTLPGDIGGGLVGAGTMVGVGLAVKLAATKTPLAKIPGVGNIIGGAFSAAALWQGGGTMVKNIKHGIGGAFSAKNWKESPFLTAAGLVEGIKSVLELIGHVCNVLSGLAYAFAAIAAVGGLLSFLFPPLAFLVPYIPVAVNFGRACGGIATVCLAVANLLSPVIPILQAIHLIFMKDDPIHLAEVEEEYHSSAQGAIANYAAMKGNQAIQKHGIPGVVHGDGKAAPKALGSTFIGGQVNQMKEGFGAIKASAPGGNFNQGTRDTKEAMGLDQNNRQNAAKQYFDPNHHQAQAQTLKDKNERQEEHAHKEEHKLDNFKKDQAYVEKRADIMQERLDANPTDKNFRNSVNASQVAEQHEVKVAGQEAKVHHAHQAVAGTERAADINKEFMPGSHHMQVQGETGDAANALRGALASNHEKEKVEGANKTATTAAHAEEHATGGGHGGGGEGGHEEVKKDAEGHVQLPEPPGNLQEIEGMDSQVEKLEEHMKELKTETAEAAKTKAETTQQATGLKGAAAGVKQHVQGEQSRSKAKQAEIQAETADMQGKSQQAHGKVAGGTNQAASPLSGIASAARTVDGLLARVPSNRFFDVSSAKNNVHQFVVGMDTVMGAPGQQQQAQGQATAAVGDRTQKTSEAANKNTAASNQGNKLAADMTADAAVAQDASSKAGEIAAEGKDAQAQTTAKIQQLKTERNQKWAALVSWAAKHRELRESVLAAKGH